MVGPFLRTHHAGGLSLGGLVIPDERRELILQPDFMDVFGDMGADVISLPAEDVTVDYCRRALAHAEREHWSLERLLTGPEYDYLFGFDGYRERSMEDLATVPPDDKASCVFDLQVCAFSVLDYHDLLMALGGDRLAEGGAAGAVAAAAAPAALAAAPPPPAGGGRCSAGSSGGRRGRGCCGAGCTCGGTTASGGRRCCSADSSAGDTFVQEASEATRPLIVLITRGSQYN